MQVEFEADYQVNESKFTPIVSVVVHTYNQEKYIAKCIEGIIAQDYFINMDVLIIDDCSTDGTLEVCRTYEQQYKDQIRIVALPENELSQGLYVGIQHYKSLSSKYIGWCDGDDYWIDPQKVSKQVSILERNPLIGIVHSDFYLLPHGNKENEIQTRPIHEIFRSTKVSSGFHLVRGNYIKQSTVLMQRKAIDLDFIATSRGVKAGDWLMCISASRDRNIVYLQQKTTVVRVSQVGIWNGLSDDDGQKQKSNLRWHCASQLPDSDLRNSFRRAVVYDFLRNQISKSNVYQVIRPAVHIARKARRFFLKN